MEQEGIRVSSASVNETPDPVLDAWDREVYVQEESFREVPERLPDDPFDMEFANPVGISLLSMLKASGRAIPPELESSKDAGQTPVLVHHSITPFYKAGQAPSGVWGMGYRFEPLTSDCHTVGLAPLTVRNDVLNVSQRLTFGIKLGGSVDVIAAAVGAALALPVQLSAASINASTEQQFAATLAFTLSALEVQGGPVGAGGARWNLYRGRTAIDSNQPLFHTILVPTETAEFEAKVDSWVRRPGRWFGLVGAKEWVYPATTIRVRII
jgi:hypothetical protein